jgi:hypothetical protein
MLALLMETEKVEGQRNVKRHAVRSYRLKKSMQAYE